MPPRKRKADLLAPSAPSGSKKPSPSTPTRSKKTSTPTRSKKTSTPSRSKKTSTSSRSKKSPAPAPTTKLQTAISVLAPIPTVSEPPSEATRDAINAEIPESTTEGSARKIKINVSSVHKEFVQECKTDVNGKETWTSK